MLGIPGETISPARFVQLWNQLVVHTLEAGRPAGTFRRTQFNSGTHPNWSDLVTGPAGMVLDTGTHSVWHSCGNPALVKACQKALWDQSLHAVNQTGWSRDMFLGGTFVIVAGDEISPVGLRVYMVYSLSFCSRLVMWAVVPLYG